jgi:DNA polymerase-1
MAFMANDPVMREIFLRGEDIHMEMARALARTIFNIAPEDAGEHERRICKTIVFALAYGKTDPAMAEELGVPVADITRARKGILGQFKNFLKFSHDTLRECRRTGHVWTWWRGRRAHRRPMWKILDADPKARTHAENGAVNARIQGTAAFFALASLPALVDWIDRERFPAKVVLSVYDSLMLEVRERHAEEAAAKMVDVMTSHDSDGVPMLVDVKVGRAWGSMQKMKI